MDTSYLEGWNANDEMSKAVFMDELYKFYGREDGLYTGLMDRFKADMTDRSRALVTVGVCTMEDLFLVPNKL